MVHKKKIHSKKRKITQHEKFSKKDTDKIFKNLGSYGGKNKKR